MGASFPPRQSASSAAELYIHLNYLPLWGTYYGDPCVTQPPTHSQSRTHTTMHSSSNFNFHMEASSAFHNLSLMILFSSPRCLLHVSPALRRDPPPLCDSQRAVFYFEVVSSGWYFSPCLCLFPICVIPASCTFYFLLDSVCLFRPSERVLLYFLSMWGLWLKTTVHFPQEPFEDRCALQPRRPGCIFSLIMMDLADKTSPFVKGSGSLWVWPAGLSICDWSRRLLAVVYFIHPCFDCNTWCQWDFLIDAGVLTAMHPLHLDILHVFVVPSLSYSLHLIRTATYWPGRLVHFVPPLFVIELTCVNLWGLQVVVGTQTAIGHENLSVPAEDGSCVPALLLWNDPLALGWTHLSLYMCVSHVAGCSPVDQFITCTLWFHCCSVLHLQPLHTQQYLLLHTMFPSLSSPSTVFLLLCSGLVSYPPQ